MIFFRDEIKIDPDQIAGDRTDEIEEFICRICHSSMYILDYLFRV